MSIGLSVKLLLIALPVIGLGWVVGSVTRAALNAKGFPVYWQTRAAEPLGLRAVRIVALGDSAMQAIGADHPAEGIAGGVASYVTQTTERPVHLTNLSSGGATTETILAGQLPRADVGSADLILVANANDLEKRVSLTTYRTNLQTLLDALPAEKTVVSDLPVLPDRKPYQQILEQETNARGVARADFAAAFNHRRRLDIFSWLLPHLNSRGHSIWFEAFKPRVAKVAASRVFDS